MIRLAVLCAVLGTLALAGCGRLSGEAFPVGSYLEAPANLQGNRYVLEAEIDAQLQWREGVCRLIAVKPLREAARLPLFIADSLETNLMVAQRYRFQLTVRRDGLLHVDRLEKL